MLTRRGRGLKSVGRRYEAGLSCIEGMSPICGGRWPLAHQARQLVEQAGQLWVQHAAGADGADQDAEAGHATFQPGESLSRLLGVSSRPAHVRREKTGYTPEKSHSPAQYQRHAASRLAPGIKRAPVSAAAAGTSPTILLSF